MIAQIEKFNGKVLKNSTQFQLASTISQPSAREMKRKRKSVCGWAFGQCVCGHKAEIGLTHDRVLEEIEPQHTQTDNNSKDRINR